jgi:hypothetical protein
MKFYSVQFYLTACHFIPLSYKYLFRHPVLKHSQAMSCSQSERSNFKLTRNYSYNYRRFRHEWWQAFLEFNLLLTS